MIYIYDFRQKPPCLQKQETFPKILGTHLSQKPRPGNTHFQNFAIREGPRRFREEKREAESDTRSRIHKTPQSAKVREASAKGNAKVET